MHTSSLRCVCLQCRHRTVIARDLSAIDYLSLLLVLNAALTRLSMMNDLVRSLAVRQPRLWVWRSRVFGGEAATPVGLLMCPGWCPGRVVPGELGAWEGGGGGAGGGV